MGNAISYCSFWPWGTTNDGRSVNNNEFAINSSTIANPNKSTSNEISHLNDGQVEEANNAGPGSRRAREDGATASKQESPTKKARKLITLHSGAYLGPQFVLRPSGSQEEKELGESWPRGVQLLTESVVSPPPLHFKKMKAAFDNLQLDPLDQSTPSLVVDGILSIDTKKINKYAVTVHIKSGCTQHDRAGKIIASDLFYGDNMLPCFGDTPFSGGTAYLLDLGHLIRKVKPTPLCYGLLGSSESQELAAAEEEETSADSEREEDQSSDDVSSDSEVLSAAEEEATPAEYAAAENELKEYLGAMGIEETDGMPSGGDIPNLNFYTLEGEKDGLDGLRAFVHVHYLKRDEDGNMSGIDTRLLSVFQYNPNVPLLRFIRNPEVDPDYLTDYTKLPETTAPLANPPPVTEPKIKSFICHLDFATNFRCHEKRRSRQLGFKVDGKYVFPTFAIQGALPDKEPTHEESILISLRGYVLSTALPPFKRGLFPGHWDDKVVEQHNAEAYVVGKEDIFGGNDYIDYNFFTLMTEKEEAYFKEGLARDADQENRNLLKLYNKLKEREANRQRLEQEGPRRVRFADDPHDQS